MAKQVSKQVKKTPESLSFFKKYFHEFVIVVFTILLYSNSLPNGYNMDDELVTINHRLTSKGVSAIPEIFTSSYYKDESGYAYDYRPFVLSTFAIEHDLFGEKPFVGHLISLLIYTLCCLVLYKVLLLLGKEVGPVFALVVTLFFAAHSGHTEAVCSIKNRDELLGLLFGLSAMAVGLKAIALRKTWLLLFVPVLYICVLLNKVTFLSFAVIIPLTLLFFTQITFVPFLLLITGLVLPVFYLVNISSFKLVLIIAAALFLFNLLAYAVFRLGEVKLVLADLFRLSSDNVFITTGDYDYSSILGWHIIPGFGFIKAAPAFISIITGAIFWWGFYSNAIWIEVVAVLILMLYILFFNEVLSWWATIVLCVTLLLPFTMFDSSYQKTYSHILSFFFSFLLLFGNSKLRAPLLVLIVAVVVYSLAVNFYFTPVLMLLAVVLSTYKTGRIIIPVAFILALIGRAFLNSGYSFFTIVDIAFLGAVAAILFLRKIAPKLIYVQVLLLLVLMAWFQTHFYRDTISINEITKATENVNTYVLKDKQDRPIDFVEQPVRFNDPQTIRIGTSLRVLYHYLTKIVLPYPLAYYYGYRFIEPESIMDIVPLLSLFIHVLLCLVAIYFIRRQLMVTYALVIYLVSIATFCNYSVLVPGIVADRYMLVPSIGWCLLLGIVLFAIWRVNTSTQSHSVLPKGIKIAFLGVLLLYSVITFARNFDWKDDLTLFRNDIEYVKESAQANNLLGLHLMIHASQLQAGSEQKKLMQEALACFKQTLVIAPSIFNTNFDVGRVYNLLDMPDSAIVYFDKAIAIDSTYYEAHILAGQLKYRLGKPREAIPYYLYVIRRNPMELRAFDFLSYIYFQLGEYENSINVNRYAVNMLPNSADPLINIGRVYESGYRNRDSAVYYYNRAYRINPLPELKKAVELLGGKIDSSK